MRPNFFGGIHTPDQGMTSRPTFQPHRNKLWLYLYMPHTVPVDLAVHKLSHTLNEEKQRFLKKPIVSRGE